MQNQTVPTDYAERVYAGVLGKIIGVYIGRPFEQWSQEAIEAKFGEIDRYVSEEHGVPLIVSDDDISGTFTFLRAMPDHGNDPNLTARQIGETWMNYIIENRTILWWGGMGMSTEHTAFLRMKHGMSAPESGSIATNGRTVAEQIGAQIFIDGWGLICPGEPDRAADFARLAGSVSHDGEAIYGAQMIAAMVAQAFVEKDIDQLIETGLALIPNDSLIAKMIADVRKWHASGHDWRAGFQKIKRHYGYEIYGGGCHMIPNHAVIIHALLHGAGDFDHSMKVVNTVGYDTDCNSGNVGCILGVRNGLAGISDKWREPVADRLYLPTADGGRGVSDAVSEANRIVNIRLANETKPRFNFEFPGSLQGFVGATNVGGAIRIAGSAHTPTFLPPDARGGGGYASAASPTLYPGQTVKACFQPNDEKVSLYAMVYYADDELSKLMGPAGQSVTSLSWEMPDTGGYPIAAIGVEGNVILESLDWQGTPKTTLRRPEKGDAWRDSWVNGVTHFEKWGEAFKLVQDEGTGLLIHGCREWKDYTISSRVTLHMNARAGIAAHVQGMKRWIALFICSDGMARIVTCLHDETVLAEVPFTYEFGQSIDLSLSVNGEQISASVNGDTILTALDSDLKEGGIAFILTEGRIGADEMKIE